ncbi:MAG: c-type cytochrome [Nitrosomonadales bacterium]|nr:c-type cytochrome [Nitrosomonadales bacterium]
MNEKYDVSGVPTTGHVWDDDLGDFTNQPPKWWILGLAASALFVVVYWTYYPSIPFASAGSFFKGIGGWTAIKEMEADKGEVDAIRGKFESRLKDMTPAAILADNELSEYVKRSGKVLFGDNCAACHGQNGVGTRDKEGLFAPILNDDDWLYGGKIDNIHETITGGRQGIMMAHKDSLKPEQIDAVAKYVLALSEGKGDSETVGKKVFMESDCTACHGPDGKGIQAMGSANLTDKVYRFADIKNADGTYGISADSIRRTITYGVNSGDPQARVAAMPGFKAAGKLSDAEIKKLAVYVYKFGGGLADAPAAAQASTAGVAR